MSTPVGNPSAGLSRAVLAILSPPTDLAGDPGGPLGEVRFRFNPSQLRLGRSASWTTPPAVAYTRGAPAKFTGAHPANLRLEVFLDASGTPGAATVQDQVALLLSCCEVTPQSIAAKARRRRGCGSPGARSRRCSSPRM
ncbi:hypothetical protein [Streptomyces clavuligerus]|uniref:hypothetical protein n=1 Tax=Streptomyces clavuligerus TaxID=1901 RepID=UPI0030B87996